MSDTSGGKVVPGFSIGCKICGEYHTEEELLREHAHHCPDWDFMLIDVTSPEIDSCTCKFLPMSNTTVTPPVCPECGGVYLSANTALVYEHSNLTCSFRFANGQWIPVYNDYPDPWEEV